MTAEIRTSSSRHSTCRPGYRSSIGCATIDSNGQVPTSPRNTCGPSTVRQSMAISRKARLGSRKSSLIQRWTLLALFFAMCLVRTTTATFFSGTLGLQFSEELIYDRSEPPPPRVLHAKRDEHAVSSSDGQTSQTKTASSTSSIGLPSTTVTPSPLPSPFDNALGNNFTAQSCPTFIQNFLSSDDFKACLPFSMLLKTSTSFFRASQSSVYLTQTLDATCNVNFAQCSALMSSLAGQIKLDANCGADFALQNPIVDMAYNGFVAYQPLYRAGCMVNNASGSFCYVDAITNASSPTGSYMYYLPLGVAMPGGTRPPCNRCVQDTMALFASAAANGSVPALSANYLPAAEQVDITCGPTFAQTDVKVSAALTLKAPWGILGSTSIVSIFTAWFLL